MRTNVAHLLCSRSAAVAAAAAEIVLAVPPAAAAEREAAFRCPPIRAPGYCGDGAGAVRAGLGAPAGVAARPGGGFLVADAGNNAIRLVARGRIRTVAGLAVRRGDRRATRVSLSFPTGVAALPSGGMLVADAGDDRVLELRPGRAPRVIGTGLRRPMSAVPAPGGVLVADTGHNRIRLVRADGTSTTVAGTGAAGSGGDGGPAAAATLDRPAHVLARPDGGFAVATADGRVREVDAGGTIRLVAGPFAGPPAIARGEDGLLRIADPATRRVVRLNADGSRTTLVRGARCSRGSLRYPAGLAITRAGDLLIADTGARRVLRVRAGRVRTVAGGGLRIPRRACADDPTRMDLLAPSPLPRGSPDRAYSPPPPPPSAHPPGCVPRSRWRFTIRFLFIRQSGHVVSEPRSRRGFRLYMYVSAPAGLAVEARRGSRLRWRSPRHGSSPPRGGKVGVKVKRLQHATYRIRMQATSELVGQRICETFTLRVRR